MPSMMDLMFGSTTDWPTYTLIIVVIILGLISIYLSYSILAELKEIKRALEKMGKLLESVE